MNDTLRLRLALRTYENMAKKREASKREWETRPPCYSPNDVLKHEQLLACYECQRGSLNEAEKELATALATVPGMSVYYGMKRYWIWSREDGSLQQEDGHGLTIESDLCLSEDQLRELCVTHDATLEELAQEEHKEEPCPWTICGLDQRREALEAVIRAHGINPANEEDWP